MTPCFMMLGGGVGDAYQPIEKKYCLARGALKLMCENRWPVHILTKSSLVKRDSDIIQKIHEQSGALISVSFSSMDPEISAVFEPGLPSPEIRLDAIRYFKALGIPCGMFLMPVIPFLSDTPEMIEQSVKSAKQAGVDFIIFSGMTLKEGRQQEYFMDVLLDAKKA